MLTHPEGADRYIFEVTNAVQKQEVALQVYDAEGNELEVTFTQSGTAGNEVVSGSLTITVRTQKVEVIINENEGFQVMPAGALLSESLRALVNKIGHPDNKIRISKIMKAGIDKKRELKNIIES